MVRTHCTYCGCAIMTSASNLGEKIMCPRCRAAFVVRQADPARGEDSTYKVVDLSSVMRDVTPPGPAEAPLEVKPAFEPPATVNPQLGAAPPSEGISDVAPARRSRKIRWVLVASVVGVAAVLGLALVVVLPMIRPKESASTPAPQAKLPEALPTPPAPTSSSSPAFRPPTLPSSRHLPGTERLSDNVGMIVVYGRYAVTDGAKMMEVDWPVGTGSCFAVSTRGLLLTNRHVTDARRRVTPGSSTREISAVLKETVLVACFGDKVTQHYRCKVLYESPNYDMAVVKVDRQFDQPLRLAESVDQGEDVLLAGFPGAVTKALREAEGAPIQERVLRRIIEEKRMTYRDWFPESAYGLTVTKGIVSALRTVKEVQHIQTDATASLGNSGGPLLNKKSEVVGILTWGAQDTPGYSFAVDVRQLREELRPYLLSSQP